MGDREAGVLHGGERRRGGVAKSPEGRRARREKGRGPSLAMCPHFRV